MLLSYHSFFEPLEERKLLAANASISGFVFNDANSNGKRDSGEAGISHVTVYLDVNNNKKRDPSEKQTTTDSSGNFSFTKLNAGTYIVRQIVPDGFTQTVPTHNFGVHVTLKSGQKATNKSLGDAVTVTSTPAQPFWGGFGLDPQHTADSPVATQDLKKLKWQTTVDQMPQFDGGELTIHYGSPVITKKNTVIVPVKTTADGGFTLEAHRGSDGSLLWQQSTDYILPPHFWTPEFQPAIAPNGRVYFPGPGGTVYYRDNLDGATGSTGQIAFYGLSKYTANKTKLNASVFIDTPITVDASGNLYFGIQVTGSNPLNIKGGLVRIAANGTGTTVAATTATNDAIIDKVAQNCAPALSSDGSIVYVTMNHTSTLGIGAPIQNHAILVALDSTTLKTINQVRLQDPAAKTDAIVSDISTASPTVGLDGDVFYGVLDTNWENHERGFMLHFSSDLKTLKTPASFGWDDTPSIVPASMAPSYHGASSYLLLVKYNDYIEGGGSGVNKLAILDPNATQSDPTTHIKVMKEVLTIAGVTPDQEHSDFPGAVREWCINSAAVDPATFSVLANSEDGSLYRWDLRTNSFTQKIALTGGVGEAYTPTSIGADGTVFAINKGILWAVGA